MKDVKIGNYKRNARDEISFKVTIKPGDFNFGEEQLIKNADSNGDSFDLEITGLKSGDKEKVVKNKKTRLHMLMLEYCEKNNIKIESEKERIYNKYGVISRGNLSELDLETEIKSYEAGIFIDNIL